MGAQPILMSAPGPFPLKGEMFFDLRGCFEWDLWSGPRARQFHCCLNKQITTIYII